MYPDPSQMTNYMAQMQGQFNSTNFGGMTSQALQTQNDNAQLQQKVNDANAKKQILGSVQL
ncbi:hypothetical protein PV762_17015 [Mitsuaria sp. CC2]|uniref:hypothetical protein n=1 Tax=Mitsuaria sp. CC2 TaxID=3029186 RepID=UPI003B8B30E7